MDAHTPAQNRLIGAGLVLTVSLGATGTFQLTQQFDAALASIALLPLLTRLSGPRLPMCGFSLAHGTACRAWRARGRC